MQKQKIEFLSMQIETFAINFCIFICMFQSAGSAAPTSAGHQSEGLIAGNKMDLA